jgi:hypothetical protein
MSPSCAQGYGDNQRAFDLGSRPAPRSGTEKANRALLKLQSVGVSRAGRQGLGLPMRRFVSLSKKRSEAAKREAEKQLADEKKRKAEKPWWHIKNWNWTAIATCVMAAFTIGIYFIGRYQWHTFQDQLTVMQGQLNVMES